MKHPLQALCWYWWASNRLGLMLCLFIFLVSSVGAQMVALKNLTNYTAYWVPIFCVFGAAYSGLVLVNSCSFAETQFRSGRTSLPLRWSTLPISTAGLVAGPLALGCVLALVAFWAWGWFAFAPMKATLAPSWGGAMICVGAMLICQSLVWGFPGLKVGTYLLLAVILTFFGINAFLAFSQVADRERHIAWCIAICLASVVSGLYFCHRNRRGQELNLKKLRLGEIWHWFGRFFSVAPARFKNPAQAQAWLEWRQVGLFLPLVAAVLGITLLAVSFQSTEGPLSWVLLSNYLLFTLIVARFVGLEMAAADPWKSVACPPFLAVRPFHCGEFVLAKLRGAFASTFLTWLILAAVLPWFFLRVDASQVTLLGKSLQQLSVSWEVIFLLIFLFPALTWRGLVASLPSILSGRRIFFQLAFLAGFVLFLGYVLVSVWVQGNPRHEPLVMTLVLSGITALVCSKFGLAGWFLYRCWKRGDYSLRTCFGLVLLYLAMTGALLRLLFLAGDVLPWNQSLVLLLCLMVFPLARFGLAPLALAWNRHR